MAHFLTSSLLSTFLFSLAKTRMSANKLIQAASTTGSAHGAMSSPTPPSTPKHTNSGARRPSPESSLHVIKNSSPPSTLTIPSAPSASVSSRDTSRSSTRIRSS